MLSLRTWRPKLWQISGRLPEGADTVPGWISWVHRTKRARALSFEEALAKLHVQHYEENLLNLSEEKVRTLFGFPTTHRIQKALYLKNIIWQLHEQIQRSNKPADRPD